MDRLKLNLLMQNEQNFSQLMLRPLMKFGCKAQKVHSEPHFVPFCLIHERNLLPRTHIPVT
jgi:hypothetical protein